MENRNHKDNTSPFIVPEDFFGKMEERTLGLIRAEEGRRRKKARAHRLGLLLGGSTAVAAATALLLLLPTLRRTDTLLQDEGGFYGSVYSADYSSGEAGDTAGDGMRDDEMDLLLALYESDIFIQQQ